MLEAIDLCKLIAFSAHAGQLDKMGRPYITHPARIVESLEEPILKQIAWLHDVLEDTHYTEQDLYDLDVQRNVIEAVVILTRRKDESYVQFIDRIIESSGSVGQYARKVKMQDINDNLRPERSAGASPGMHERYEIARSRLAFAILQDEHEVRVLAGR